MPADRLATGWLLAAVMSAKDCDEYEEKCPYQLPIRELLDEKLVFYEKASKTEGLGESWSSRGLEQIDPMERPGRC
jgi:hypothetical protein